MGAGGGGGRVGVCVRNASGCGGADVSADGLRVASWGWAGPGAGSGGIRGAGGGGTRAGWAGPGESQQGNPVRGIRGPGGGGTRAGLAQIPATGTAARAGARGRRRGGNRVWR